MAEYRHSICEPLNPEIMEKGEIKEEEILNAFREFPWNKYLEDMDAENSNIHYSPSLEIENKTDNIGLTFSAVGKPKNYEFYVFFKRPKMVKKFFGFGKEVLKPEYISDRTGINYEQAEALLNALINKETEYLESWFS